MRIYALLLPLLIGCATAQVTGYRDPSFTGAGFKNVAVYFPSTDLEARTQVENQMARQLGRSGVSAGAVMAVISPTEAVAPEKLGPRLLKEGFDSLLLVTEPQAGTTSTFVPGYATYNGGYMPGYVSTSNQAKSNVTLSDLKTGKVAWVGTVSGTGYGLGYVISAMVGEIVERLLADEVLANLRAVLP